MTQSNTLALTVLPNGFDTNGNLRLTVVLTPSISTDDGSPVPITGTPFDGWTSKIQKTKLSWSISFTSSSGVANLPATAIMNEWNPDLWTAIFGGKRAASNRKGNSALSTGWRLSHNISELHDRHRRLRAVHAHRALNAKMANLATDANTIKSLRTVHEDFAQDFECLTPPILYLFPTLNGMGDASVQVDQRNAALTARSTIDSAAGVTDDQKTMILTRVTTALDILETQEGARLQAPALYCIYRHCVASALPVGVTVDQASNSPNVNFPLYLLYKAFTDAASPLVPKTCSASGDPVSAYEHYVLLLLYHRGKPASKECTLATPDFHQVLGMVNHYPAMLRPLGLAFDLTVALPAGFADGAYIVQVANPLPDNTLLDSSQVMSYQTRCWFGRNNKLFYLLPRDPSVMDQGYLALDAAATDDGSVYNLAQDDADGSALKFIDQAQNSARSTEYSSAAPTAMTTVLAANNFRINNDNLIQPTPASSANPTDAPPAARTVGISLFHEDRLPSLETTVKNTPPASPSKGTPQTPKTPTDPLCAEDLMLGIRVDVKDGTRQWHSLCNRKSTYTVHYVDDWNAPALKWCPAQDRDVELAADEGFVTFAATQTDLADGTSQTQLHQSLFTWSGWSLSVPKPEGFQSVNEPPPTDANCKSSNPLSIFPMFELPTNTGKEKTEEEKSKNLLPALRFNHDYKIRCRVVDLAGNSMPCVNVETPHTLALNPMFARHDPIRAPLLLLSEPIDRKDSPGEHVDRLVARNGDEPASRYLVPPRESLRLAELHNAVTKQNPLPGSAFTGQNLMPDGSFPSVQQAHDQGWWIGEIDEDKTNNQDIIFLNRKYDFKAKNPYYPDPLAHYIRVKPFLVSDNPNWSRPLGSPFYIEIDPDDAWPNYLATIVDLNANPDHNSPSVDYSNDDRPPSIVVNLPPAYTVVLVISSAGYNRDNPKPHRTDKTKDVALYQFHMSTVQSLKSPKVLSRQVVDFAGGKAHQNRLQARFKALAEIYPTDNSSSAMDILDDPNSYVDGDLPQMTPPRTLTFVHATRRPLAAPDFGTKGKDGDLRVIRARGEAKAAMYAGINAHWLSTGKITCHSEWQDMVDDLKNPAPGRAAGKTKDVAFAITSSDTTLATPEFDGTVYLRILNPGIAHSFTDTRAHDVTYTLSAATRFRGYFPEAVAPAPQNPPAPPPDESAYSRPKPNEHDASVRKLTVLSSVRPPAPSIAYMVPAFLWRDTYERKTHTWFSGRDVVLRVYLERPFLVSGDQESIGVVIATQAISTDETTQPLVSRWGSDPVRPITEPIESSALTAKNLCQPNDPVQTCQLAEGGVADVKPCEIHYAEDRKLWFSDIPINTLGSYAPFLRLAFVRWQPQAIYGEIDTTKPQPAAVTQNVDCRISPVVIADFIQLSPDRWVSVQRVNDSRYNITVSGVFPPPEKGTSDKNPTFTLTLYSRWYATGKDTGWRQIASNVTFTYTPAPSDATGPVDPDSSISSWTAVLNLAPSAAKRKYRVLLRENEWFPNSTTPRVSYSQFVDLP
jgi:hypothetical protein